MSNKYAFVTSSWSTIWSVSIWFIQLSCVNWKQISLGGSWAILPFSLWSFSRSSLGFGLQIWCVFSQFCLLACFQVVIWTIKYHTLNKYIHEIYKLTRKCHYLANSLFLSRAHSFKIEEKSLIDDEPHNIYGACCLSLNAITSRIWVLFTSYGLFIWWGDKLNNYSNQLKKLVTNTITLQNMKTVITEQWIVTVGTLVPCT